MPIAIQQRKGITLLFVVSMIVLFLLMGTAFVVVSNDFLRASRKRARIDVHTVEKTAFVEHAFYELIRGPSLHDMTSPLRGHSLLADMYGYGFTANIATAEVNDSEHFITLTLDFAGSGRSILDGASFEPDPVPCMAGLVLSVVSGPTNGLATRIVDHQVTGNSSGVYQHTFVVLPHWIDNSFAVSDAAQLVGQKVVVNGRPFSGTGAGNYDSQVSLNQPALSIAALRPDLRGIALEDINGDNGPGYFSTGSGSNFSANHRGPNESYDTFDFQNMFLAGIKPDGSVDTPSFYRDVLLPPPIGDARALGDFRAFKRGGPENNGVMVDNDNNGQADGIWMDIGLPSQSTREGVHYKPLISYTVIDLDGRINVNAHGNLLQANPQLQPLDLLGLPDKDDLHRGQGYGPPEVDPYPVLLNATTQIISSRYGMDGKPGEAGVRDVWSNYKLFGYPDESSTADVPGTVDGHFGTTMDIHGRFAIGFPNDIRDINDPQFPIGMPVADMSTSSLASEAVDSAYEMTFADDTMAGPGNRGFDRPFTARELEVVLRRFDLDSNLLDRRLMSFGGGVFDSSVGAANSVTTASFEVPTIYNNLPYQLYQLLDAEVLPTQPDREQFIRDTLRQYLPPKICRGLPMNVNRPFGDGIDNNGNGVVDEMGESGTLTHPSGSSVDFDEDNDAVGSGDSDAFMARIHFARHLYIVTLLSTERIDRNGDGQVTTASLDWYDFNNDGTTDEQDRLDYRKLIAQWAINVVDFRDADSIMTPFEVDLDPWNGWGVDNDITTVEGRLGENRIVVWGSERPELLISETFASHDRRTQDLDIDPTMGTVSADDDDDFDSHLVPAVSAFFELYNPWVMNDANQVRPAELYDESLNGVDLQKVSADGSSPVWRLFVTDHNESELDPDDARNNNQISAGPPASYETTSSVRRIYFAQPSFTVDAGPEVYFPNPDIEVGPVAPGVYAVVGSAGINAAGTSDYVTYFGRRITSEALDELDQTRRIVLDPENAELEIVSWDPDNDPGEDEMDVETRSVVVLPIGQNDNGRIRNLGVSDPVDGYRDLTDGGLSIRVAETIDGQKFVESESMPGTETDYAFDEPVDRKIDQPHYDEYLVNDGVRPGYRTVHLQRLANPLLAFHPHTNPYRTVDSSTIDLVVFNGAEPLDDPNNMPTTMRFGTHERQSAENSDGDIPALRRLLFKHGRVGHEPAEDDEAENDNHIFNFNLTETLGGLNEAYRDDSIVDPLPFAWLTWNNRPFASQLELANVPFTSSYWLTRLFNENVDPDRDVYQPPAEEDEDSEARNYTAHFPHLLNFYADELEGGSDAASLHRIFDYLEVPSRFVGTESYVNPDTFANNQHGLSFGLTAPFDTISNYRYPGKININTILDEKVWKGLMRSYATGPSGSIGYSEWDASRNRVKKGFTYANPLRSPTANNLVPDAALVVDPSDCGLFRKSPPRPLRPDESPLFDYDPASKEPHNDDDRSAYFKNDMRQRMGNLVTNRSSVFAVWVTVGYFEMNPDGSLKTNADQTGFEIGSESGQIQRHRGFFIVDRSIPVAFEPGKNHNVDRAVLVRSIIE